MKIDVVVPTIGESVTEATMGSWLKDEGAFVEEDEIICEIESEKATVEITAEKSGVLHQKAKAGETLTIGALIAEIEVGKNGSKEASADSGKSKPVEKDVAEKSIPEDKKEIHSKISPVAANMLEKSGIKADNIQGSGVGGRVTKADVIKELNKEIIKDEPKRTSSAQPAKKASGSERIERREKMTTLRKTIARRLLEAKNGTAMLTTFNEVDLLKVKQLREEYKESFKEKYGIGLGFMSLFTKACSIALLELPQVNAMIEGEEIVYHDYTDIGIAVSTDKGLVVPVIRDVQSLSLAEIELEVARIAARGRDNKLTVDEMTGGTFSITNGGVFGSMMATPIINAPQSAILGMHAIKDRPVVVDGQIVIRPMMYIALSYDHRIIDGKESVTFLKRVKELLEDPIRMVLEV